MKEIADILQAYKNTDFQKRKAALATVIHVEGSSYRRTGARMLIFDNGQWIGGISGGCLEGDALLKAQRVLFQNQPQIVTYDTREEDAHQVGIGLGCNGLIRVLIAPLRPDDERNPLEILKNCVDERRENILLTITDRKGDLPVSVGDMFRVEDTPRFREQLRAAVPDDTLFADIRQTLQNRKSKLQTYTPTPGTQVEIFIEYLPPRLHLVLFGSNYDIYPFVGLAKSVGWKVSVVGNLSKLHKDLFATADAVFSHKKQPPRPDENTALVLMAHDYQTDLRNLRTALLADAPYIGVLGPKKRFDKILNELKSEGIIPTPDQLRKIHAPVGLDTGATTPEEIAIAIIAEIRAFFAGRNGGFLKWRDQPIHTV